MRNDPIPPSQIKPSAYAKCWQQSFRRGRCPHGQRFHSPEDQCQLCVIETSEDTPLMVNMVQMAEPEEPTIKVVLLHPKAQVPKLAHEDDAGFDLRTVEALSIGPGETSLVPTGLAMKIPQGYKGEIKSRSGLTKAGIIV